MWSINYDEAFVLDTLSILIVKSGRVTDPEKKALILNEITRIQNEIISQYGIKKFKAIMESKEFDELTYSNEIVFELVEDSEKDDGLANEVAEANLERWERKNKLQKKFFKKQTKEVKVSKI
jgi:NAD(P)H-flavin reductase